MDVNVQLLRNHFGQFVQYTYFIQSLDVDVYGEYQRFSRLPLYGNQTVAEAGFQLGGNGTLAFMDDNAVVVVDISQYIVARDRLAAVCQDVVFLDSVGS